MYKYISLFQLVSATALSIKANHTSLDGLQGENITISLSPTILTGGCRVSVSISDTCSLTVVTIAQSRSVIVKVVYNKSFIDWVITKKCNDELFYSASSL